METFIPKETSWELRPRWSACKETSRVIISPLLTCGVCLVLYADGPIEVAHACDEVGKSLSAELLG